jgi:hypothetical protein
MPPPGPPVIWHSELFDGDYGVPRELCHPAAGNANVYTRAWSKATVSIDCSASDFAPSIVPL